MATAFLVGLGIVLAVTLAFIWGMSLLIERLMLARRITRIAPRRLLATFGAWICAALVIFALYIAIMPDEVFAPTRSYNLLALALASCVIPAPATIIVALVGVLRAWHQSRRTTLSSGTIEETFG